MLHSKLTDASSLSTSPPRRSPSRSTWQPTLGIADNYTSVHYYSYFRSLILADERFPPSVQSSPRNDSFVGRRPRSRSPLPRFRRRSRSPLPFRRPPSPISRQTSYPYGPSRTAAQPRREEFARSESTSREERGRGTRAREGYGGGRDEVPSRRECKETRGKGTSVGRGVRAVRTEREEGSEMLGLELGQGDASTK